jgi:hypothetical protein
MRTRGASSAPKQDPRGLGVRAVALRRGLRCVRLPFERLRDKRRTSRSASGAGTMLPRSRRPSMLSRILASRLPHAPDSSGPRPTFVEIARRPAARRRVAERASTPFTDRTRPESCPDERPTHDDVATAEVRPTGAEQALESFEPPDIQRLRGCPLSRRSSEVLPPRGVFVLRSTFSSRSRRPWKVSRQVRSNVPLRYISGDPDMCSPGAGRAPNDEATRPLRHHTSAAPPLRLRAFGPLLQRRGRAATTDTEVPAVSLDDHL